MSYLKQHRRHRGIFVLDALICLFILVALSMALAVSVTQRSKASARLAESRAALNLAEAALQQLQTGGPPTLMPPDTAVTIAPIATIDAAAAPAGMRWIEARAVCRGREAVLIGLVPLVSDKKEAGAR